MYNNGKVTLQNGTSGAWYQTYLNYASQNSINTSSYENYNAGISRAEFVRIFSRFDAVEHLRRHQHRSGRVDNRT
jgi:hypothetical protein